MTYQNQNELGMNAVDNEIVLTTLRNLPEKSNLKQMRLSKFILDESIERTRDTENFRAISEEALTRRTIDPQPTLTIVNALQ